MRTAIYTLLILLAIYAKAAPTELSVELIKKHEGYSTHVYKDTHTYSIGWGTNLSYITKAEATYLLHSRLTIIDKSLDEIYPWYAHLPYIPKTVILDMTYNVGINGFHKFRKMHYQLSRHNWTKAALEMKNSLWFKQTKTRSKYLFNLMRNYK